MSNDNTETKADGGESSLTGGLEVTVAMMTNTEIASAIAYAFDRCDQRLVGGYTTSNTEPGKAMLEHLKKLLAIQYDRARMVTTSNAALRGGEAVPLESTVMQQEAAK